MSAPYKRTLDSYDNLDPERIRRAKQWRDGNQQGPVYAELYPTMQCNLNCLFCRRQTYFPPVPRGTEMTDERLLRLVDELVELDALEVCIKGGGEPLLRPKILEHAAKRFSKALVRGQLITNGTLLDDKISALLVDSGWMEVCFSIDSPDAQTHDYLRDTKGAHSAALKNLRALAAARLRSGRKFPIIKINMVLTARNCAQLEAMLNFCADNDVNNLSIDAMDPEVPGCEHLLLSEQQIAELESGLKRCEELAAKLGIYTNLSAFENPDYLRRKKAPSAPKGKQAIPCLLPRLQCSIRANGSLVPCCLASDDYKNPVLHTSSLKEAWDSMNSEFFNDLLSSEKPWYCGNCTQAFADSNMRLLKECGLAKK